MVLRSDQVRRPYPVSDTSSRDSRTDDRLEARSPATPSGTARWIQRIETVRGDRSVGGAREASDCRRARVGRGGARANLYNRPQRLSDSRYTFVIPRYSETQCGFEANNTIVEKQTSHAYVKPA